MTQNTAARLILLLVVIFAGCRLSPGDEQVRDVQVRPTDRGVTSDASTDDRGPLADAHTSPPADVRLVEVGSPGDVRSMDAGAIPDGGASDAAASSDTGRPDIAVAADAALMVPDGAIQPRPPGPDEDLQVLAEWLCEQICRCGWDPSTTAELSASCIYRHQGCCIGTIGARDRCVESFMVTWTGLKRSCEHQDAAGCYCRQLTGCREWAASVVCPPMPDNALSIIEVPTVCSQEGETPDNPSDACCEPHWRPACE